MGEVIDLDALVPPSATLKWRGGEITFNPPLVEDMLRIGQAASKIKDAHKLSADELGERLQALRELFYKHIPELKGEMLTMNQLLVLVTVVQDMATPPDVKELEARGITVGGDDDDPKKKKPGSSNPSPTS